MSLIKYSTREITCKIVYYGPGRCGKTTNLQYIHRRTPPARKGEMMSLATETDRTLFFDLLPLDVGKIGPYTVRFQLYTVPGQVYYDSTRRLVLQGADGVVFVVDSQKERFEDNLESFENLMVNLKENGLSIETIPVVVQYNKRDLPEIFDPEEFHKYIAWLDPPWFEAIAIRGDGVIPTFKEIGKRVLHSLKERFRSSGRRG